MINLINGDCLEGMKSYPDKYFDLAIIDPPYGIDVIKNDTVGGNNLGKAKKYGAKKWDEQPPNEEYFKELKRVSKNQIIWGANHFISKIPFDSSCWVVWDKENSGNFADCELAWTSFHTAVRKFSFRWNGMLQGNMKDKEIRIHPTQKPVALYKWILTNYAKNGYKILDTHTGSGSIMIACYDLGFDLVCFEIDKEYYDLSLNRLQDHTMQCRLFTEKEIQNEIGITEE